MEDTAAGKPAYARIVKFPVKRWCFVGDSDRIHDFRGRDQAAGHLHKKSLHPKIRDSKAFRLGRDIECKVMIRKRGRFRKRPVC